MKKFIFGVMLLVSMLGIVGCSMNPSDSENAVYRVKNSTSSDMTVLYENKSGVYVNEKTISANEIYEVPANAAKTGTEKIQTPLGEVDSPVIYLQIKVGDITKNGYAGARKSNEDNRS